MEAMEAVAFLISFSSAPLATCGCPGALENPNPKIHGPSDLFFSH
jgi:hypothetical protein